MTKTIYLHIGIPKTGTTSIQSFCSIHRASLEKRGLLYPETMCSVGAHFELSDYLGFQHSQKVSNQAAEFELLLNEIERSSADKVLLSSENFVLSDQVFRVKEAFKNYVIKPVIYLRRHDQWWESAYQQSVKQMNNIPWGIGFKAFYDFQSRQKRQYWKYLELIELWETEFGQENIILRLFDKSKLYKGNVVTDLFQALDFNAKGRINRLAMEHKPTNESLSAAKVKLLELIKFSGDNLQDKSSLIDYVLSMHETTDSELLSVQEKQELIDENRNDYEKIASKYFVESESALF